MGRRGFTIVELLIVIVVIALLATVTIVAMNGLKNRAENTRVQTDLALLKKAIMVARDSEQKTLPAITSHGNLYGRGGVSAACNGKPAGTDLAALPRTDKCWVAYTNALNKISTASGINVRNVVDPLGRPYSISEEEESTFCLKDQLWAFSKEYDSWGGRWPNSQIAIPFSGFAGCS